MKFIFVLLFVFGIFFSQGLVADVRGPIYIEDARNTYTPLFNCVVKEMRKKYQISELADVFPTNFGTAFDVVWATRPDFNTKYRFYFQSRPVHVIGVMVPKCPTCTGSDGDVYVRVATYYISYDSKGAPWSLIPEPGTHLFWGVEAVSVSEVADVLYEPIIDGKIGEVKLDKINLLACKAHLKTPPEF